MQAWMVAKLELGKRRGFTLAVTRADQEYAMGKPVKSKVKVAKRDRWVPSKATALIVKHARAQGRDLLAPSNYAAGRVALNLSED